MLTFAVLVCGLITMIMLLKVAAICICALLTARNKRKEKKDMYKVQVFSGKKVSGGGISGKPLVVFVQG